MFDVLERLELLAKITLGDPEMTAPVELFPFWVSVRSAKFSQDHDMTINLRKTVDFLQSRDDR